MRIAIVNHTFDPHNGQANVNLQVALRLARRGHRMILVGDRLPAEIASEPNIEHVPVAWPRRLPTNLLKGHRFARTCERALKRLESRIDVLHVNGAILHRPCDVNACHFVHHAWLRSPFHPRPAPWRPGAAYQWLYTRSGVRWERAAYADARRVVAVSKRVAASLRETAHLPDHRLRVVHSGVDLTRFRPRRPGEPNRLREAIEAPADAVVLLFAGDLKTPRKNLDVILRALRQCEGMVLAAAGGYEGGPYPRRIREMGLSGRVVLLGHRSDLADLYRGADAFVFCSHFEPFGLVVLEAMASGAAVVTCRSVGASSLMRDGKDGLVIADATDATALADHLRGLRDDPPRRRSIGASARLTAQRHDWDRVADQYEAVYRQVLEEKRTAAPWSARASAACEGGVTPVPVGTGL